MTRDRKEYLRKYYLIPEHRNARKVATARCAAKLETKAKKALYDATPKRKLARVAGHKKYQKTPKGRATNRRAKMKQLYGITQVQYDILYEHQGGCCAICLGKDKPGKRLVIDHDHASGIVRGLLCDKCNVGIGLLRDSPRMLRAALVYLEK